MGCNSRVCEPQRGLGQDFSEGGGGSLSVFQSLIVVCISAAQDSQRREGAVLGQKGAAVFQAVTRNDNNEVINSNGVLSYPLQRTITFGANITF